MERNIVNSFHSLEKKFEWQKNEVQKNTKFFRNPKRFTIFNYKYNITINNGEIC